MKILIIGKVWPEPTSSAAGKRMKQLISLLQKRGTVYFACASTFTGNEMNLEEIGVKPVPIVLNDDSVNDFFAELQPDVVVYDRFITEEQYGWRILEHCPQAFRILNTEDLHFLRNTRKDWAKKNNAIAENLSELDFENDATMRELASIYRCDVTLLVSPFEMQLLQDEMKVPASMLMYLPLFAEKKEKVNYSTTKDFLFVGNFLHEPNADAVKMLVQNGVWEEIYQQLPQAKLYIAGAYPTQQFLQMHQPKKGIHVLGHVKDLDEIYRKSRIILAPLRFGAGIKGKILESMEYGIPFVSTSIGFEGMNLETLESSSKAQNWDDFVRKAVQIYQNETEWNRVQNIEENILLEKFSSAEWKTIFSNQFDYYLANYKINRRKNYFSQLVQHHSIMSSRYLSKWIMEKNKS